MLVKYIWSETKISLNVLIIGQSIYKELKRLFQSK